MTLANKNVVTANLAAVNAATAGGYFKGPFNVSGNANAFTGAAQIERSFDDGTNWVALSKDLSGTPNSFTASFSIALFEIEDGVMYRVKTPTRTAGSIDLRLGQNIN